MRQLNRLWAGLCVVLVVGLLMWRWTAAGFKTSQSSEAVDLLNGAEALDSFSEPELACTIVRQRLEQLQPNDFEGREQIPDGVFASIPKNMLGTSQQNSATPLVGSRAVKRDAAPVTRTGAWQQLDRLRPRIQGLNIELEQKLMAFDYRNGSWDRYVDDYLALLRMAPETAELFAMHGLVASERCGRSEEVAEALRQLARFGRNPKVVRNVKATIEAWWAGKSPSQNVSEQ